MWLVGGIYGYGYNVYCIPANRPTFGGTVPLLRVVSHCPAKRTLIPRPATTPCGRGGEVEFTHARNVNNAHQLELS